MVKWMVMMDGHDEVDGHDGRVVGSINLEKVSRGCNEVQVSYIHHRGLVLGKHETHQSKHEVRFGAQRLAF